MIPDCTPNKTERSSNLSISRTTFVLSTDNNSLKYLNFYSYDFSDIRYFGVQIQDGETGQLIYDDKPFAPSYNSENLIIDYTNLFNESVCSFLVGKSGVQLDSWLDSIFYPFIVNNTLFLAVKVLLRGRYKQNTSTLYSYTVRTVVFKFENDRFTIVLDIDEPALYLGLSEDLCVQRAINFWSKYRDQRMFSLIDDKYLISLTEWDSSADQNLDKGVLVTIYEIDQNNNFFLRKQQFINFLDYTQNPEFFNCLFRGTADLYENDPWVYHSHVVKIENKPNHFLLAVRESSCNYINMYKVCYFDENLNISCSKTFINGNYQDLLTISLSTDWYDYDQESSSGIKSATFFDNKLFVLSTGLIFLVPNFNSNSLDGVNCSDGCLLVFDISNMQNIQFIDFFGKSSFTGKIYDPSTRLNVNFAQLEEFIGNNGTKYYQTYFSTDQNLISKVCQEMYEKQLIDDISYCTTNTKLKITGKSDAGYLVPFSWKLIEKDCFIVYITFLFVEFYDATTNEYKHNYVINSNHPNTPIAFAFVFVVDKENPIVDNKLNAELKEVIAISEAGDYYNAKKYFLTHEDKIFFFK